MQHGIRTHLLPQASLISERHHLFYIHCLLQSVFLQCHPIHTSTLLIRHIQRLAKCIRSSTTDMIDLRREGSERVFLAFSRFKIQDFKRKSEMLGGKHHIVCSL